MKRIITALSAVLICGAMCGCGAQSSTQQTERSVYSHGQELCGLIGDIAESDEYLSLYRFDGLEEYREQITAADYKNKTPEVYELCITSEMTEYMLQGVTTDGMSVELKRMTDDRIFGSLPNLINASFGSEKLAMASIFAAEKSFVSSEITENTVHFCVFDKDSYPIMIAYTDGDSGAVSAGASLIFGKLNGTDEASVRQFLTDFNPLFEAIEIRKIENK